MHRVTRQKAIKVRSIIELPSEYARASWEFEIPDEAAQVIYIHIATEGE